MRCDDGSLSTMCRGGKQFAIPRALESFSIVAQ
jgi:hypothetical protein